MFVEVRPTPDLFGFILRHSLVIEELAGVIYLLVRAFLSRLEL
jgi:hypothetical protein